MSKSNYQQLSALLPATCLRENVALAPYASMRTGGPAALFAEPETQEQLQSAMDWAAQNDVPVLVLGNGSNLLISDSGFDGLVVHLGKQFSAVTIHGNTITAQAGALLSTVARAAASQNLTGMEFAAGIPGSVGGAVCMNAGAYGGEIAQVIVSARVLTQDGVQTFNAQELALGYRSSAVMQHKWTVLEAVFSLSEGDPAVIQATMADLAARRREKQPLQYPSCGSFFKRPVGHYAGALIEQAGLKGYRVGDAQVSPLHAGFIINCGHATSSDIYRLMRQVQSRVLAHSGVMLEPEVRLIGKFEA